MLQVPFHNLLGNISDIIAFLSVIIIIWGVLITFVKYVYHEITERKDYNALHTKRETIRHRLGSYIMLGLEMLIAADIVETVINPSLEDIGILASIVLIRTVIGFFLEKELGEGCN